MNRRRARTPCDEALTILLDVPERQTPMAIRRARAHAARCPHCASVLDDPTASHRALHVLEPHRASPAPVLRVLLAVCAATQLVLAAPWLFGASLIPDERVAVAHLTRDGALGIIIATTGLLVASRPRYALVATLIGSIIFAAQLTTGVVDNHDQQASMVFELWHILVFAILALAALTITIQRRSTPHHGRNQQAVRVF